MKYFDVLPSNHGVSLFLLVVEVFHVALVGLGLLRKRYSSHKSSCNVPSVDEESGPDLAQCSCNGTHLSY